MWAFRPWVGRHLSAATPQGRELAEYARILTAVEGNTTFYASPSPSTVVRWSEQAPSGFRFVFKLPQEITHRHRLVDTARSVAEFVDLLAPLGDQIGSFTMQLPATFAPTGLAALDRALAEAPPGCRWSVEVRHPEMFDGVGRAQVDRLLADRGAERVLLDSTALFSQPPRTDAGRDAWSRKPRVAALRDALGDEPIVRFIGSDDPDVTTEHLATWVPTVADWIAEGRRPTIFVHTPDNLDSPGFARWFHAAVDERVQSSGRPPLEPLPSVGPLEISGVTQTSLF
jgi:uncharacterized protein YecE (DUF72 family)